MNLTTVTLSLLSSLLVGLAVALLYLALIPLWDRLTTRHTIDLTAQLQEVYVDTTSLPLYFRLWGVALIVLPLVLWYWLGLPLLAVFALYLLYRLPRAMVRAKLRSQRIRLRDQLVAACINLANTTRAGLAFTQGLKEILPETPSPLAPEFRRIVGEFEAGRPLAHALRDSQQRLRLESYTLFTTALLVCLDRGGRVTDTLERVSSSLVENQRLERKRDADTASGTRVVQILAFAPLGFLGIFAVLDPKGTSLIFVTLLGQFILAIVAVLDYVAVQWARSILKLDSGAR